MLDILPRSKFSILWSLLILGCRSALLNHPLNNISGDIYFKVNNESNRTMFEICSKLTLKTPEQEQRRHSGAFIVTFEQNLHIILVLLGMWLKLLFHLLHEGLLPLHTFATNLHKLKLVSTIFHQDLISQ